MKKQQKNKLKELKNKLHEAKHVDNLQKNSKPSNKLELREIKNANRKPKGKRSIKNTENNILELKNVNKTYVTGQNKHEALKDVSFAIKKGEFAIILGESGSGKTSLLNVLSGLDRPTRGEVIVDNINIAALKNKELTTFRRNKVGFIFQNYNLLMELNAIDNAEMGRQLQTDNNKRIDLDELFDKVGLSDKKKKSITSLSGGESQRVSIIRAISKNPKILCADEPTGALDLKTSRKIIKLFWEINKKYGTTIILVTHNESYVEHASKVIRVIDGAVNVQVK